MLGAGVLALAAGNAARRVALKLQDLLVGAVKARVILKHIGIVDRRENAGDQHALRAGLAVIAPGAADRDALKVSLFKLLHESPVLPRQAVHGHAGEDVQVVFHLLHRIHAA